MADCLIQGGLPVANGMGAAASRKVLDLYLGRAGRKAGWIKVLGCKTTVSSSSGERRMESK
jgi:hypothetical protein